MVAVPIFPNGAPAWAMLASWASVWSPAKEPAGVGAVAGALGLDRKRRQVVGEVCPVGDEIDGVAFHKVT